MFSLSKFTGALDQIAPSKQIRIKQRTQPWMSSEILDLIKQRDHYLSVFRRSKQKAHYDMFITMFSLSTWFDMFNSLQCFYFFWQMQI